MSASRFDPLDMALTALHSSPPPAATTPSSSEDSNPSKGNNTSNSEARRRAASEPKPRAAPTTSKRQLNIYLSADTANRLRHASIALGGQHSLGDIVEHLVNSHLEATIEQLGATGSSQPTRLRAGRKLRGTV